MNIVVYAFPQEGRWWWFVVVGCHFLDPIVTRRLLSTFEIFPNRGRTTLGQTGYKNGIGQLTQYRGCMRLPYDGCCRVVVVVVGTGRWMPGENAHSGFGEGIHIVSLLLLLLTTKGLVQLVLS